MKKILKFMLVKFYGYFFYSFFNLFKLFPLKNKITFVVSFGDNTLYLYDALKKSKVTVKTVFLCKKSATINKEAIEDSTYIPFETSNFWNELKSIYHLATSQTVVVDSYFGFLASVEFKAEVECIQVWHAVGAFKQFGLKDHSLSQRTKADLKRFNKVYQQFGKVVVGSNRMSEVFQEAFGLSEDRMLKIGVPRSDLFFNNSLKQTIIDDIYNKIPKLKEKKVILYAPTFRDNELDCFQLKLNVDQLLESLGKEYVVLLKLHPAIRGLNNELLNNRCFNVSTYRDINHLLLITDILISDYSSVPFEFSLLHRPIIFFTYDLNSYKRERGLWSWYEGELPGPLVFNTDEVINAIKNKEYSLEKVKNFAENWNVYSTGNASEQLAQYILKKSLDTQ